MIWQHDMAILKTVEGYFLIFEGYDKTSLGEGDIVHPPPPSKFKVNNLASESLITLGLYLI